MRILRVSGCVTSMLTLLPVVALALSLYRPPHHQQSQQQQQQHQQQEQQQRYSHPTRAELLRGGIGAALGLISLGGGKRPVTASVLTDDTGESFMSGGHRPILTSSTTSSSSPSAWSSSSSASSSRLDLSDEQLKDIITSDIVDRQFTATANMTRSIYDASIATFMDENITYSMDQWIHGTQQLFVGENSRVRLVGEVNVSPEQADFVFDEHLQFRIPFRPTVHLTGKVVLKRDLASGLITSYEEFWDHDVVSILLTAKF